jgi:hypothetical protein
MIQSLSPRGVRYSLLFAATALALVLILLAEGQASMLARLRDSGVWTQGQISDARCYKSLHFDYSFVVAGNRFQGVATAPIGCCVDESRSICDQFSAGRSINIVYLSDHPDSNFYSDPSVAYESLMVASCLGGVFLALGTCSAIFITARSNTATAGRWLRAVGL